jgi:potassium inwardly-rectifying channel subfamily J
VLDLAWSKTLTGFAASFLVSWFLFAVVWYLVVLAHGDLNPDRPDNHTLCVDNIKDFTSCFLFSLETQHTIGWAEHAGNV